MFQEIEDAFEFIFRGRGRAREGDASGFFNFGTREAIIGAGNTFEDGEGGGIFAFGKGVFQASPHVFEVFVAIGNDDAFAINLVDEFGSNESLWRLRESVVEFVEEDLDEVGVGIAEAVEEMSCCCFGDREGDFTGESGDELECLWFGKGREFDGAEVVNGIGEAVSAHDTVESDGASN